MCTAATYQTRDFYFGRTLDYEFSYGDEIVITPRNFPFPFREAAPPARRYAMIGMAHVAASAEGEPALPLYYEAVNEKGLGIAGLNFVGSAAYFGPAPGKDNIAQWELIPWLLGQCASLAEAQALLARLNLRNLAFAPALPPAQLHWLIADKTGALTVESVPEGLKIYDNPVGVLANNPSFDKQLFALNNYRRLTAGPAPNTFAPGLALTAYSRGMGALGLPGDLSSQSRFVRAAFVRMNSASGEGEAESVGQFFHILGAVEQQRGCCVLENGGQEITLYTCCCNASRGIYYYTTYGNRQITAVELHRENLDGAALVRYAPVTEEQIARQN